MQLVVLFLLMPFVISIHDKKPSPVIIIPGLAGSEAFVTLPDGTTSKVWGSKKFLIFPNFFMDNLGLRYNFENHTTSDHPGHKVVFPGFGSVNHIVTLFKYVLEVFLHLVGKLEENDFYVNNFTLRGAPYDFRKTPSENEQFFSDLKILVENTYNNAGQRRVMLLGYSLGSLYTLIFLKKMDLTWKKKFIRGYVSVGAPLAGSPEAMQILASGKMFPPILTLHRYREFMRTQPVFYFLWPNPKYFPKEYKIIRVGSKSYSARDYKELFKDIKFKQGIAILEHARKQFDPETFFPEGVDEIYCFYSRGLLSQKAYQYPNYTGIFRLIFGSFPDIRPTMIYGDGDDVVPSESLSLCEKWPGVKTTVVQGIHHKDYFTNPTLIKKFVQIFTRGDNN